MRTTKRRWWWQHWREGRLSHPEIFNFRMWIERIFK
jgi:hypothetical protein